MCTKRHRQTDRHRRPSDSIEQDLRSRERKEESLDCKRHEVGDKKLQVWPISLLTISRQVLIADDGEDLGHGEGTAETLHNFRDLLKEIFDSKSSYRPVCVLSSAYLCVYKKAILQKDMRPISLTKQRTILQWYLAFHAIHLTPQT